MRSRPGVAKTLKALLEMSKERIRSAEVVNECLGRLLRNVC
jgi:hypothetical protein